MSTYRIQLSHIASFKLRSILEYVELEWSVHARNDLLNSFVDITDQISKFPKSCPEYEDKPGIFKAVVNKHVSFYYQIQLMETIEIITVFDNRQDPEEIEREILRFI